MRGFLASLDRRCELAEIFDTAVRTATEEHVVDFLAEHRFATTETHVIQSLAEADPVTAAETRIRRHFSRHSHPHTGIGTEGDHRFDIGRIERIFGIETGVGIGIELFPPPDGFIEVRPLRSVLASLHIIESSLVRSDHAAAGAALDTHVADRHAFLHRQVPDRLPGKFDKMPGTARCGNFRNDIKDNVLRRHARLALAVYGNAHRLGFRLQNALRSEHHFDLRGPDTESHGTEGAVRRGMAVTADDRHARLGKSLLRADNMYNTVPGIA